MAQVLDRKETQVDTPSIMETASRVMRLKDAYLNLKGMVELDQSIIETRVMKETEGEAMLIRRAKAFAAIVREMPVNIAPDELIVGYTGATQGGVPLPARIGPALEYILGAGDKEKELGIALEHAGIFIGDGPKKALGDEGGIYISNEDRKKLEKELLPYWRAQSKRSSAH